MGQTQVKKVTWWHQSIVDWQLAHPDKTLTECAAAHNVTLPWLSTIRNSDVFRDYEAMRREEHNANVSKTIVDQVEELAGVSLEVLKERIDDERDEINLGIVTNTAELALKSLGFMGRGGVAGGMNGGVVSPVQVNVYAGEVDKDSLARAREKLRTVNSIEQQQQKVLIDEPIDADAATHEVIPDNISPQLLPATEKVQSG